MAALTRKVLTCARCGYSFELFGEYSRERKKYQYEIVGESHGHQIENLHMHNRVEPEVMIVECSKITGAR